MSKSHGTRIAYYRVSSTDQSIEAQRNAMAGDAAFDREFSDEGVSGTVLAADRKGFSALLKYVRSGDTLFVFAVDRLGRDALDVQSTVRGLLQRGVAVHVQGLGLMAEGVGELILAVLAQVADMERKKIIERTQAGRATAREHLARTGRTHKGKLSLGRPAGTVGTGEHAHVVDPSAVVAWRRANGSSLTITAAKFGLSVSSVKRYCANIPDA